MKAGGGWCETLVQVAEPGLVVDESGGRVLAVVARIF